MGQIEVVSAGNEVDLTTSEDKVLLVHEEPGPQGPPGIKGDQGDQGPEGPQGIPGASASTYTHTQVAMATVWTVTHNLLVHPQVTVVDTGDNVIVGDVHYVDLNSLTVTFTAPFSGKAYVSA